MKTTDQAVAVVVDLYAVQEWSAGFAPPPLQTSAGDEGWDRQACSQGGQSVNINSHTVPRPLHTSGLSRQQRGLGRLKLAQRYPMSHVSGTPLSRSKGRRSRSPGRCTQRGLNAQGGCSGQHGNLFGITKYCYGATIYQKVESFDIFWAAFPPPWGD